MPSELPPPLIVALEPLTDHVEVDQHNSSQAQILPLHSASEIISVCLHPQSEVHLCFQLPQGTRQLAVLGLLLMPAISTDKSAVPPTPRNRTSLIVFLENPSAV